MQQFCVTTSMGKRLIGKGMVSHPDIQAVLTGRTLVIIAGTTNGYVAEEILKSLGQAGSFSRRDFRRGVVAAPGAKVPQADFAGDVVICDGQWQQGETIFDVAADLKSGDIVLKGGNAFDLRGQAAVHIGHSAGGTIHPAVAAVVGRRARLIVPIGLEKRVLQDVHLLSLQCNSPDATGPRLYPMPGAIFTELHAIELLTGAQGTLIAAGGVYGAEGAAWVGVTGTGDQIEAAAALIRSVAGEPPCCL